MIYFRVDILFYNNIQTFILIFSSLFVGCRIKKVEIELLVRFIRFLYFLIGVKSFLEIGQVSSCRSSRSTLAVHIIA
jgi:hypothetical protein